MIIDIQSQSQ